MGLFNTNNNERDLNLKIIYCEMFRNLECTKAMKTDWKNFYTRFEMDENKVTDLEIELIKEWILNTYYNKEETSSSDIDDNEV